MNLFLTGTDTNVGKTYVATRLVRALRKAGADCVGLKPICCGDRSDAEELHRASGDVLTLNDVNPVWLRPPAAPYTAAMIENRAVDLALIRERAQSHPRKLRELLSDYFAEMQRRNKMIEVDAEAQAMTFMWMNYGAFMSQLFSPSPLSSLTPEQFRESSVDLFVRALSP